MKLYFFPIAPNPTKVCLHLAEKAAAGATIDIEPIRVDLTRGEQRSPQHAARNPLERLPVLELDDGTFLCESLAIIEYLEELHPQPSLWGDTPLERARARDLERLADSGVLLSIGRLVHATRSPLGLPPSPEIAAAARTSLEKSLAVLETRFADGRPFVAGSRVTVADCTLAAALQFGRFAGIDAVADCPNVARWDAAYRTRPAARSVLRA